MCTTVGYPEGYRRGDFISARARGIHYLVARDYRKESAALQECYRGHRPAPHRDEFRAVSRFVLLFSSPHRARENSSLGLSALRRLNKFYSRGTHPSHGFRDINIAGALFYTLRSLDVPLILGVRISSENFAIARLHVN